MKTIAQNDLRNLLKTHQKQLEAGDQLPSIVELANIAGVHRDTIYSLLAGRKINARSQYALSKVMLLLNARSLGKTSKLMSIKFISGNAKLFFGICESDIFRSA
jgi:hypothetical protein